MLELFVEQFHFLRPMWLLLIPCAVWLYFVLARKIPDARHWTVVIPPELLQHMTVGGDRARRLRPYQVQVAILILASVAMAGPTWQKEVTPFTQDKAPLIIALELTPTMLAVDQQPTRLDRAKQKILDTLETRTGARTGLIAYAGSAHIVLPLTEDADLIKIYLESLEPSLMPKGGDDAVGALDLAATLLDREDTAGTVLFMTDGVDRTFADPFAQFVTNTDTQVLFMVFGGDANSPIDESGAGGQKFGLIDGNAPPADVAGTQAVSSASGGELVRATPDARDVDTLSRSIRRHLVNTVQEDENLQWKDAGYWVLWPLALLLLLWFRRGWTTRWS